MCLCNQIMTAICAAEERKMDTAAEQQNTGQKCGR